MSFINLTAMLALLLGSPPGAWPGPDFQRGVVYSSWDGSYPASEVHGGHLDAFEALGVTWIQVLTFAHQPQVEGPVIDLMPEQKWPRTFIALARARGFKVLLKPHVWSRGFYDGSKRWRGSIKMPDEASWARWFAAYEAFIVREARFAKAAGVEMFSVGLEYVEASKRGADWRRIVRKVRAVYDGTLTYAADGNHELAHIGWWDAVDVIGVNAYFKLSELDSPSAVTLRLGWTPHLARLEAVARKAGRPIVFTEAGYPSVSGATRAPWQWPSGKEQTDTLLQARAYDALMGACTSRDWCRGVFWWKWYEKAEKTPQTHDYDPSGKPASSTLGSWYLSKQPTKTN
jgi:hypothetical protein